MTKRNKFLGLVSNEMSDAIEKAKWRRDNEGWLSNSQTIALKVLEHLHDNGISQKEFATNLGVTPQQVSKWLKGDENLRLSTIDSFERVLGIKLIEVVEKSELIKFNKTLEQFNELYKKLHKGTTESNLNIVYSKRKSIVKTEIKPESWKKSIQHKLKEKSGNQYANA